jgi:hypothetical protein
VLNGARATFGALRCYRDIQNGDNLDSIYGLQAGDSHVYCIAYNVPLATPCPTPTPKPTATPTLMESTGLMFVDYFRGQAGISGNALMALDLSPASGGSSSPSSWLAVLLMCLAVCGVALVAVQARRRLADEPENGQV